MNKIISKSQGKIPLYLCCLLWMPRFNYSVLYNYVSIAVFLLLPYFTGPDDLLCSHPNLIVANTKSTAFCEIQGSQYYSYVLYCVI